MLEFLPDWFHVSSDFVYALVAFLGAVLILMLDRHLEHRTRARIQKVEEWRQFQEYLIRGLQRHTDLANVPATGSLLGSIEPFSDLGILTHQFDLLGSATDQETLAEQCSEATRLIRSSLDGTAGPLSSERISEFSDKVNNMLSIAVEEAKKLSPS